MIHGNNELSWCKAICTTKKPYAPTYQLSVTCSESQGVHKSGGNNLIAALFWCVQARCRYKQVKSENSSVEGRTVGFKLIQSQGRPLGSVFAWFRLEGYPGQDRTTNRCSAIAGERRSHFAASVGDVALATLTLIILLTDIVLGASTGSAAHTDVYDRLNHFSNPSWDNEQRFRVGRIALDVHGGYLRLQEKDIELARER